MSQDFNLSGQDGGTSNSGDRANRVPPRTWIIWLLILGGLIFLMFVRNHIDSQQEFLSEYDFLRKVDSNLIAHAVIHYNPQGSALTEIKGTYYSTDKGAGDGAVVAFRTQARLTSRMEERLLSLPQFEPQEPNQLLTNVLWSVLPIILIAALIWFFFIRQIKKVARVQSRTGNVQTKTEEQQSRMDKVLDKWEEQAKRMDAVLDQMERERRDRS